MKRETQIISQKHHILNQYNKFNITNYTKEQQQF